MEMVKISDNFKQQLSLLNKEQYAKVMEMFEHYYHEYKRMKKENPTYEKEIAQKLNVMVQECIDSGIEESKVAQPEHTVSCHKGCSFCCFLSVDVSDDEAILLTEVIEQNKIDIDYERLEKQLVKDADEFNKLPLKTRRCVLLGQDGGCKAYEFRPTGCRKLIVLSDPKLCDTTQDHPQQTMRMANLEAEVISNASAHATESGTMAEMLLKFRK